MRVVVRPAMASANSAVAASSSSAGTTRLTRPRSYASGPAPCAAVSASSFARCTPMRCRSNHEVPKSRLIPRSAKIAEKRARSEHTVRSQAQREAEAGTYRDAVDAARSWDRTSVHRHDRVAEHPHPGELVAHRTARAATARTAGAAPAQVGAGAEVGAAAGEHDHARARVGEPAERLADGDPHVAGARVLGVGTVDGDGGDVTVGRDLHVGMDREQLGHENAPFGAVIGRSSAVRKPGAASTR